MALQLKKIKVCSSGKGSEMHRIPVVERLPDQWTESRYDAIFCGIGYEARARHIANVFSGRASNRFAIGFDIQKELEYESNQKFFKENGYQISVVSDASFEDDIAEKLASVDVSIEDPEMRVLVDISSLSRFRLASYVDLFARRFRGRKTIVDFVYSLAEYDPPVTSLAPNSHVGPVLRSNFTGGWDEPDRAVTAVVGLGYEPDKALGAVDYLEAASVWTFIPLSEIPEYSAALQIANEQLLEDVTRDHQFTYLVQDPVDCFLTVEAVVSGVMLTRNVVLLPFGPKLFALCCLLVATLHPVAVWRVSAQQAEPAVNRRASGHIYGVRVTFHDTDVVAA